MATYFLGGEIMKVATVLIVMFFTSLAFGATPPEGSYEWVSTQESPGVFTTPGDLGYTIQREFNADMTYNEYRDEELFRTGDFWVVDIEYIGMIIPTLYIDYGIYGVERCAYYSLASGLEFWWGYDIGAGHTLLGKY